MPAKPRSVYVCSECGYETAKWVGKCPNCNMWNTMTEEVSVSVKSPSVSSTKLNKATAMPLSQIDFAGETRYVTGISELDRVLGGGIVKGSVVLLSGDPGIGKSTILLQVCNALQENFKILYVSGEESALQIKMRAGRMGIESDNVSIMTETDVTAVCEYIKSVKPHLVMIDSIQTMQIPELSSSPASIVQVRESTNMLLHTGKSLGIPVFIVGHVNKGGDIAGPKVIGVFEMTDVGLREVENPSAMLLSGRMSDVSGGCITCVMEGTRPILAEVQGLVTMSGFGNARRTATGFDYNRLNLLLAVLEKRLGLNFSNLDAYVNIVGGMRLDEPAADLAVAMALVSGLRDIPIDEKIIAFGEVGLSGELRSVPRAQARINEAARLGFTKCILPKASIKQITSCPASLELIGVRSLGQAISVIR